mgnify:CR=1 FL=1
MIDWRQILDEHGIDYVLGPAANVRKDHIGINCPLCGNDTKHHYSISLTDGKVRGCWRDPSHWLSPAALLSELTGMAYQKAKDQVSGDGDRTSTTAELLRALSPPESQPKTELQPLEMPSTFQRFTGSTGREEPFARYLRERGLHYPQELSRDFDLRWCGSGRWAPRIVFPIYRDQDGLLVGWTSRAIGPARARYLAHPEGDAMERLVWQSSPEVAGATLVVVEGPFDALKVAAAGVPDVVSVALLTNHAGPAKLSRLVSLGRQAERTIVLLDEGAEAQALDLASDLAVIHASLEFVPPEFSDPGEMGIADMAEFLESV